MPLKTSLKTIAEEAADCVQSFKDNPEAKAAWCCHHAVPFEYLTESFQNRINYILSEKKESERALRLRNFRPVRVELPAPIVEVSKVYAEASKARAEAWKACAEALNDHIEAWKARNKASKARDEASKALDKAWNAYVEASKALTPELMAYHNRDWPDNSWNGKSIFQ